MAFHWVSLTHKGIPSLRSGLLPKICFENDYESGNTLGYLPLTTYNYVILYNLNKHEGNLIQLASSLDIFFPRYPDFQQNLTDITSTHLLLQVYTNLRCSHNHSHNASKPDYHMLHVNDSISDHAILSF